MKTTIYANYGILAHEKQTIYTTAPTDLATVSEPVTVEIPARFAPGLNGFDEVVLTIGNTDYLLGEILSHQGNKPALRWYDGNAYHWALLNVVD